MAARETGGNYDPNLLHPNKTQDTGSPIGELDRAIGWFGVTRGAGGEVSFGREQLFDPRNNALAAARYLKKQYQATGNWRDALIDYNNGPGSARRHGGSPTARQYADIILGNAGQQSPRVVPNRPAPPQSPQTPLTFLGADVARDRNYNALQAMADAGNTQEMMEQLAADMGIAFTIED